MRGITLEGQFTAPRKDFIEAIQCIITYKPNCAVPPNVGKLVILADPDEIFFHVELPDEDNKLEDAILWTIDDWRTNAANYALKKELNHLERMVSVLWTECRGKMMIGLKKVTGIDDATLLQQHADRMIKKRSIDAAKAFGADITELIKADEELVKFKQENKIK